MVDLTPVKYRKLTPDFKVFSRSQTRLKQSPGSRGYVSTEATERKVFTNLPSRHSEKRLSVLASLKKRHGQSKLDSTTPEAAASIIKDYILPLFEADCSRKGLVKRSSEKGLSRKFLDSQSGTLYADIKLSDKLAGQLTICKAKNEELTQKLLEKTQSKLAHKYEARKLRAEVFSLHLKLETSNSQNNQLQGLLQSSEFASCKAQHEVEEYKDMLKITEGSFIALKEEHTKVLKKLETAEYSTLVKSQELELLKAQFEMIAHNLKLLNKLMNEIYSARYSDERKAIERLLLTKDFERQVKLTDYLSEEYNRIYTLRKAEQLSLSMLDGAFSDIRGQREKAIKYLAKKNDDLTNSLNDVTKDNLDLRENFKDLTKKYDSLTFEFRRLWKKHSINQAKHNKYTSCKRCEKMYDEEENFNWSCRVHFSSYDSFWLCCGKKERGALGCSTNKHLPADAVEKLGLAVQAVIVSKEWCIHCKQIGHGIKDCPKDPNRGGFSKTEVDRVPRNTNISIDSLYILRNKYGRTAMANAEMSSSSDESQLSDSIHNEIDISIRDKLKKTMKIRGTLDDLAFRRSSQSYILQVNGNDTEGNELPTMVTEANERSAVHADS